MAQVAGSSVLVVGQRFYDDSNTARTVAFIDHIHIGVFITVAGCLFDDAVDVVVWHVVCLCLCNQVTQLAVVHRVRSALTNRYCHFTTDLGKDFSLLGIGLFFFTLDIIPLRMSGHRQNSLSNIVIRSSDRPVLFEQLLFGPHKPNPFYHNSADDTSVFSTNHSQLHTDTYG